MSCKQLRIARWQEFELDGTARDIVEMCLTCGHTWRNGVTVPVQFQRAEVKRIRKSFEDVPLW